MPLAFTQEDFLVSTGLYINTVIFVFNIPDVEQGFLPWLMDCVENQLEVNMRGRVVLDGVLREVVQARMEAFEKLEAKAREEQLAQEAAQALVDGKSGEENTTSAEAPTVTITEVGDIKFTIYKMFTFPFEGSGIKKLVM